MTNAIAPELIGVKMYASQQGAELFDERPDVQAAFTDVVTSLNDDPLTVVGGPLDRLITGGSQGQVYGLSDHPDLCVKISTTHPFFRKTLSGQLSPIAYDLKPDMAYMEALSSVLAVTGANIHVPGHFAVAKVGSSQFYGSVMLEERLSPALASMGQYHRIRTENGQAVDPMLGWAIESRIRQALQGKKLFSTAIGDLVRYDRQNGINQPSSGNIFLDPEKSSDETDIWLIDAVGPARHRRLMARLLGERVVRL